MFTFALLATVLLGTWGGVVTLAFAPGGELIAAGDMTGQHDLGDGALRAPDSGCASWVARYRRDGARDLDLYGELHRYIPVLASWAGYRTGEIDVATALAVSWKPFVKSNASAVATTIQRTTSLSMV